MTKEEVAQVIAYCDENKISYKQYLAELGVNPWSFYDAKRKYAPKNDGENAGEFLQLVPEGPFLPNPIKPSRSRSSKQKDSAQGAFVVSIELRTPTGTMMRISGNLTRHELLRISGNANRDLCTKNGIQTSYVQKGKRAKEKREKDFVRQELARVRATAMEGSFGTQKEHYSLRRIKARKKETEILYIFFGIHTANAVLLAERLKEQQLAEAA